MYPDESQEPGVRPQLIGPCPDGNPPPCLCGLPGQPVCPIVTAKITAVAVAASSVAILFVLLDHLGRRA